VNRRLSDVDWQTAQRACTAEQLQALIYWRDGYGYKRIGIVLGISRDAARGRIDRGLATLKRELVYPTVGATITTGKRCEP
jgi:DNA-directed RNA polymerase specialized sigma24 family protein